MSFHILSGANNKATKLEDLITEIDYGMKIHRYDEIVLDVEDDIKPLASYSNEEQIVVFYLAENNFVDMKISLLKHNFRTKVFRSIAIGDIAVILGMVERTF